MAAQTYCETTFHYHDGVTGVAVASTVLGMRHVRRVPRDRSEHGGRTDHP